MDAEFDGEETALFQVARRLFRQPAVEDEPVLSPIEREHRLMLHFLLKMGDVGARDVGRIRKDAVIEVIFRQRIDIVPEQPRRALIHRKRSPIFFGDSEGFF